VIQNEKPPKQNLKTWTVGGQFMETWPLVVAVILSLAMLATPLLTHTDTPTDDEGALIKKEVEE
jgi:hypothetical protein